MNHQDQPIFDINRPERVSAPPTSRPVIVGHRPTMPDPMVTGRPDRPHPPKPNISAQDFSPMAPVQKAVFPKHLIQKPDGPPGEPAIMEGEPQLSPPFDPHGGQTSAQNSPYMPVSSLTGISQAQSSTPAPKLTLDEENGLSLEPKPGVFGSSDSPVELPQKGGRPPRKRTWLILGLLLALIAYLAVDALTSTKLPLELFKKADTSSTPDPVPLSTPAASQPSSLPAGFSQATVSGTNITFTYPSAWGRPASTVDKGFTQRSAKTQPEKSYAYVVTFPDNKDVELAVTSGKYLPPARAALYYDFLQWCTGTVDGKIYKSVLRYTSSGGVDTPSTVVCDQGPLTDAVKVNSDTVIQANTKGVDGSILGDIYTRNLNDATFVVARLKDKSMKNGESSKTLLASVSLSSTPAQ